MFFPRVSSDVRKAFLSRARQTEPAVCGRSGPALVVLVAERVAPNRKNGHKRVWPGDTRQLKGKKNAEMQETQQTTPHQVVSRSIKGAISYPRKPGVIAYAGMTTASCRVSMIVIDFLLCAYTVFANKFFVENIMFSRALSS